MTNPIIQTDLVDVLNRLDQRFDNFEQKLDTLQKDVSDLKIGQAEIRAELKGEIKSLDTKVEQLDKRISNSEFTNRGILIGLIVVIFGGIAKLFGLIQNP